jgi:hypothetical protein
MIHAPIKHTKKEIPIYLLLHHHTKYNHMATGASINIDQKSGWSISNKKTHPTITKNGINPSKNDCNICFFFFMKYANITMSHIFMNSTGWIDGIHGILSHHLAQLYSSHTKSTANKSTNAIQKIFFAFFSKNE